MEVGTDAGLLCDFEGEWEEVVDVDLGVEGWGVALFLGAIVGEGLLVVVRWVEDSARSVCCLDSRGLKWLAKECGRCFEDKTAGAKP
jgi:hypothetical protein